VADGLPLQAKALEEVQSALKAANGEVEQLGTRLQTVRELVRCGLLQRAHGALQRDEHTAGQWAAN
jgi:hypothetical protein